MPTTNPTNPFAAMISTFSPDIQEIARHLHALILDLHPDVTAVYWPQQKIAGFGLGPKKMSQHYCYIAPQSKHVNLGFNHGAALPDPDGLLQGNGKALRHIKLYTLADLHHPAVATLLRQALAERTAALQ